MKRTTPIWYSLALGLAACSLPIFASAQQAVPKPPMMEKLEDTDANTLIPEKESGTKMTERREQGKVKEVQVQSGGSNYTVKANEQPGSILPGDAQSTATKVPMWKVLEFDLGAHKERAGKADNVPPPPVK